MRPTEVEVEVQLGFEAVRPKSICLYIDNTNHRLCPIYNYYSFFETDREWYSVSHPRRLMALCWHSSLSSAGTMALWLIWKPDLIHHGILPCLVRNTGQVTIRTLPRCRFYFDLSWPKLVLLNAPSSGTPGPPPGSEAACSRPGHQTAPFWWRHEREIDFTQCLFLNWKWKTIIIVQNKPQMDLSCIACYIWTKFI
jgi:hypothetical protein